MRKRGSFQNKLSGGFSSMPGGEAWGRSKTGGAADPEGQEDGWGLLVGAGTVQGADEEAGKWRGAG